MNETLVELLRNGGLKSHGSWKMANEEIVKGQEKKEPNKWKEWISKETRELILERRRALDNEEEEREKSLKKLIRKAIKEDKDKWIDEMTKAELGVKEQWQGMRFIGQPFKPKRYARRDRNGKPVSMDLRAEATKEYLAKDQWGKKEEERGNPRREELIRTTEKILEQ